MALFWENQIVLKNYGQSCGRKLLLWPKNVRYFQEIGKKRAFFGKERGKKEKYNADTW